MATLLVLATRQGGVVLRSQLADHGVSPATANRRVDRGEWQRVSDGVYRVLPAEDDLDLLRSACVALPAVVSHGSAALLHGLVDRPPLRPQVIGPASATHAFPGVEVRRSGGLDASQVTSVDRLPITTPARTLVDLATDLEPVAWADVADRAIGRRTVAPSELHRLADLLCGRGRPGSTTIRTYLEDPQLGASRLERHALRLLAEAGLPAPVREFAIPWSPRQRFDLAYPDLRIAIELDGRHWHDRPDAFQTDRERDRTAARHGWIVIRFTWLDLQRDPAGFIRTIVDLIASRTPG